MKSEIADTRRLDDSSSITDPNSAQEKTDLEDQSVMPLQAEDIDPVGLERSRAGLRISNISRTESRQIHAMDELYREASNMTAPLPPMGGGKKYPPAMPDRDYYAVAYDGPDDPDFPHNWPMRQRVIMCLSVGLCALSVSLGSAIFAEGSSQIMKEFHVGQTVATLGTSLYVFGFASGPIIWGPLSELYGRKTVLIPLLFMFVCFCAAVGAAKDIQTVMLGRFFAGFVGAAPIVVAPASMADMFGANLRGKAMTVFAMVLFGGPMLAPILGAFIVKNEHMGWRWTSYISMIIGGVSLINLIFSLKETHHGIILSNRAEELRRRTGNWGIHAPHEEVSLSIKEICEKNITRPLVMLFTEPILLLITIYNAFIYGLLYLFLTAIPLIFERGYGFAPGVAQLPYLSMLIGILIGGVIDLLLAPRYARAMAKNGGKPVPEERLPPMMIGGFLFAGGIFWLCWSGDYPDKVHWIVPTIGAAPIGMGLILIFLPCLNYIIDCYLLFAASALAGNTFLRSSFGAAFPLFAYQMFVNMKTKWAGTLLGCVGVALIPVPFLFYKYGKTIRRKSKYAFDLE